MAHEAMKADARQGQVSEQLGRLEEVVEELVHLIERVEASLGPILRTADVDESKGAVDETLVPLADSINTLAMRVGHQSERLRDILERLEL